MKMDIYSRRSGQKQTLDIQFTETGWTITNAATGGACDKQGAPHLFEMLEARSIHYPAALGFFLEWLWEQSGDMPLSKEQVQQHLDQLAAWIHATDQAAPGGIWADVK